MGVRTITDASESMSALYDSVTDTAFGPIFHADEGDADEFLAWYSASRYASADLRRLSHDDLFGRIAQWHRERAASQEHLPFQEIPF
jgi:hypothetical protein